MTTRPPGACDPVLVVDDDPVIRELLTAALAQAGYDARPAAGGREAVAILRGLRGRAAAALLDVRMPGMDGPATLAGLREVAPDLRCVFATGDPVPYTPGDLLALGADAVLAKPFRSLDLMTAVAGGGREGGARPGRDPSVLLVGRDAGAGWPDGPGRRVWAAATGARAERLAAEAGPDVIVVGPDLPDMDGCEAAARAAAAAPRRPLLVGVAGRGRPRAFDRARAVRFDVLLPGPVPPAQLRALLAGCSPAG